MNKKLFSWKALAGLALLVAMGLTSCKQNTEVDPNDPYNTQKPVTPGVITGNADVTFRLAKPSDLNTEWDKWYNALSATDKTNKVTNAGTFTIGLETSGMKLADDASVADLTMTLPAELKGKTVNFNFSGAFAVSKNILYFNVPNFATDKVVTINLPGGEFMFNLSNGVGAIVDLGGTATISRLYLANAGGDNRPITIGSGISVKAYVNPAAATSIKVNGTIDAIVVNGDITVPTDKGVEVKGSLPAGNPYRVKKLIAENNLTVYANGYKGGNLDKVSIAAGKTVTFDNNAAWDNGKNNLEPYVTEIEALGAGAIALFTNNGGLTNVSAINGAAADKKITVTSGNSGLYITKDIFTNAILSDNTAGFANGSAIVLDGVASLSNVDINGWVDIIAPSPVSKITFNAVGFSAASSVYMWKINNLTPILDANGKQVVRITYGWLTNLTTGTTATGPQSQIPADILALDPTGSRGYWWIDSTTPLYQETEDDFDLTVAFENSTFNWAAIDVERLEDLVVRNYTNVMTYTINGKAYVWKHAYYASIDSYNWILVEK
jgi:hypothetical protein